MTETEIRVMIDGVLRMLLDEVPFAEKWDKTEIEKGLKGSVASVNTFNQANQMNKTLATAPSNWRQCLEVGAAAHCFRVNASALKESDPHLAARCNSFAKLYEDNFKELAKLLTQIRPASAGSRGKRRR